MPDARSRKYEEVDWSRPTREIARKLGVGESAVSIARKRFAPDTLREYNHGGKPVRSRRAETLAALRDRIAGLERENARLRKALDALTSD